MFRKALVTVTVLAAALVVPAKAQRMESAPLDNGAFSEKLRVPSDFRPICGSPESDPATKAIVDKLLTAGEKSLKAGEIQVPVAVHLITAGRTGNYSDLVVQVQIHNLNVAYSGTPFSFYLVKLDRTNNKKWYNGCGPLTANEKAMKKRLAYKPAQVLNLYSCNPAGPGLPAGLIGYAYFPWMLPESSYLQGVVVHPGTLPTGAGIDGYDEYGLNAVHEVGHWLGLYHTFQDGCADGDQVADTPAQLEPTFHCDLTRDSCPDSAGLDDVPNFMNYVSDFCYDHFTAGQANRMRTVASVFRPSLR